MGRGLNYTASEDQFLIENAERKSATELVELHKAQAQERLWPERSKKSLSRRIEELRKEGKVGFRPREVIRRALYGTSRGIRSGE